MLGSNYIKIQEPRQKQGLHLPRMTIFITTRWRLPKVVLGFFIAELVLTIPVLALFGIADPDLYRTRLWQDGYDNGFNSNPREILYAYANHRPIPTTPLVWSQL